MSNAANPLRDEALTRYNTIDSILRQKKEEIESLITEHNALKAYLISMKYLEEEIPVKRRGRKPKDKTGLVTEKKKPGRKPKAKPAAD
ncbi:MAG: hypothetical protein HQL01_14080 [Nitrospirae bacterium]|nr:hypothetical protein [Nitrospirota bacterium]